MGLRFTPIRPGNTVVRTRSPRAARHRDSCADDISFRLKKDIDIAKPRVSKKVDVSGDRARAVGSVRIVGEAGPTRKDPRLE